MSRPQEPARPGTSLRRPDSASGSLAGAEAALYTEAVGAIGPCPMHTQGIRDILLPQERPGSALVRRLWSMLRGVRLAWRGRPGSLPVTEIQPEDLWRAFEYLAGECQVSGMLHEGLVDVLAERFAGQAGQARFDLQCRLADGLGERTTVRFLLSLRIATRMPVPQARTQLLEMLAQPGLGRWQPASRRPSNGHMRRASSRPDLHRVAAKSAPQEEAVPGGNGQEARAGFDLRPAVIAALGQLRDPSLLGLFHRLLDKLAQTPDGQRNVMAAVQWSLMNLAPGGQGEPVPAAILSMGRCVIDPDGMPVSCPPIVSAPGAATP